MKFYGQTDKGKVRKENQDCFVLEKLDNGIVAAVICDGMGGANAGRIASESASSVFMEYLLPKLKADSEADIQKLVAGAAAYANTVVYQRSLSDVSYRGMGTTMVGAVVRDNEATVFNIGDSRAYIRDSEGFRRMTRDHSLVEELVQIGEITSEEARVHPQKNLITRALGIGAEVKCDIFVSEFHAKERILLCSDGLSNIITDEELSEQCRKSREPRTLCHALMKKALSRGAPDNVTIVVIECS